MPIKISTDSTADIPRSLRESLDISVLPLNILAQGRIHLGAFHVELGFQGAGLGIETSMNDAAVSFAGALSNIRAPFQNGDLQIIPGQYSGQAATNYAGADNQYIRPQ